MTARRDAIDSIPGLLFAGIVVMLGVRAVEWAIPAPPQRILICTESSMGEPTCQTMKELQHRIEELKREAAE